MFKDRLDYIRTLFAPETEALQHIRGTLETDIDRITIYPEEGKLLQLLIRLVDAKKIVEIGTLAGYSATWMLGALPPDGKIFTLEKDAKRAALAKSNLHDPRVTIIEGDALSTLFSIEQHGPFDICFIDADKLNYTHYLDWAEKNVRKGGLVIGDNTFLFDAVWKDTMPERVRETARTAMREFNQRISDPQKYHGIMLPTAEGLTIGLKLF